MISFEENNKTLNLSQWDKCLLVVLHLESYEDSKEKKILGYPIRIYKQTKNK